MNKDFKDLEAEVEKQAKELARIIIKRSGYREGYANGYKACKVELENKLADIESEQVVLGAILIDAEAVFPQVTPLAISDFYKEAHQDIYRAMIELNESDKPVDLLSVFDHLSATSKELEETGGTHYLTYLTEIVPTTATVSHYVAKVLQVAKKRQLKEQDDDKKD